MMQIIYTRHAKQRLQQRNISPEQVRETLEYPNDIQSGDYQEQIASREYGNREIRIVYEEIDVEAYLIYGVFFCLFI